MPKTHGKGLFAHGKAFAVCYTRQTAHGKQASVKRYFAVCHLSGTRQIVCRVLKSTRQRSFQKTNFKNRKQKRFNSGRTPPASHTPIPFSHTTQPARFEFTTSPSCVTFSTTTPHSHLCLYSIFPPHIILNREYIVCLRPSTNSN